MADALDGDGQKMPGGSCPICGRPSDAVLRPFCSKRCADVDLHRWLSGSYRIAAEDDEPEDLAEEGGPVSGGLT